MSRFDFPIIVIGAGAGGLVVAVGAAKAKKKVLLIDKGVWGGDCTNFGCIPSKTLIASTDPKQALAHVREIVAQVRAHEEPEQLNAMGIETLEGCAQFEDPHTLNVNGRRVTGKQIVIATGSYPIIPPIEGLSEVPYLCNETVFDLEAIPKHLAIVGGGPIGCELGQAFHRLGAKVTLIQSRENLLMREDREAQQTILNRFRSQGIDVRLNAQIRQVHRDLTIDIDGDPIRPSHLLISAGRAPHLKSLNLERAGVKYEKKGIPTDHFGRTSQKHIFAVGDVTLRPPFTHMAEFAARQVLITLLLPGPLKKRINSHQYCPRVTYVDPEIAAFGMSENEALQKSGSKKIATYKIPFDEVDRAITAGRTEGFVKVVTRKWSSAILGATIVAPHAGEMISELTLAMRHKIPLRALSSLIHPYPTYSLAIRAAADKWLTQTLLRR